MTAKQAEMGTPVAELGPPRGISEQRCEFIFLNRPPEGSLSGRDGWFPR